MSTKVVWVFLAALLLPWCQVPTMPALAAKTPVGRRGPRNMKIRVVTRVYEFKHCTDKVHSYILKNFTFNLHKDGMEYIDAEHDLTSTAQRLMGLRMIIHRCPIGVAGKCEYFQTFSWNMPVCKLLVADNMLWTPTIQNIHPKWDCPLRKGSYWGRNMTFDLGAMRQLVESFNVDKYSWPFEVQIDSEDGLYICFTFVGEARHVRVKE